MNSIYFYELAYALLAGRLCFFTGTGFSMEITSEENNYDAIIPNWESLLRMLCKKTSENLKLEDKLFPPDERVSLSLEEKAEVISSYLRAEDQCIYKLTAEIIDQYELKSCIEESSIYKFFAEIKNNLKIITTNYDNLLENLINKKDLISIYPGSAVPKKEYSIEIFHIHGSTKCPENMVITAKDYFHFINRPSYFSRKLSTLFYENTIVIMGYSLSDHNLKSIINEYSHFSHKNNISSQIFFVSRSSISQEEKDFYSETYHIRVIDHCELKYFFSELLSTYKKVKEDAVPLSFEKYVSDINDNPGKYKEFLSFYQAIASISEASYSFNDEKVLDFIEKVISLKEEFTSENSAWHQYVQLSQWLIYLGTLIDISQNTNLSETYLKAVKTSMCNMSKRKTFGYSWDSYKVWDRYWLYIRKSNRDLIRKHIKEHLSYKSEALEIVNS